MVNKKQEIEERSKQIVSTLLRTGDQALLQSVLQRLQEEIKEDTAVIQYAGEVDEQKQERLKQAVMEKFPEAEGVIFDRNDELIGGIRVVFKDYVYDDTVKGKLQQLSTRMRKE